MKYSLFIGLLSIVIFNGCIDNSTNTKSTSSNINLPTSYTPNEGKLLASSCFQCHGTNGKSTNSWDSLSADEMDEMIGEHPLMDAIGIGYTSSEVNAITNWLSTMSNNEDNEYEN